MIYSSRIPFKLLGATFLLTGFALLAQPVPRLTSVSSPWFERGKIATVILLGDNLADINAIIFSGDPGFSATNQAVVEMTKGELPLETSGGTVFTQDLPPRENKSATIIVTVDKSASFGPREMRVIGPGGVSNPIFVQVSDLPGIQENGKNTSIATAQTITYPVAVSGVISAATQSDFYKISAKKGQRIIADVFASRTGSALDPSIAILDLEGNELLRSEDVNVFDPLLDFTIKEDGDYILALRDFRHQGSGNASYRLLVGELPYLDFLFPFGGQRGRSVELQLKGRNLDGLSAMKLRVNAEAPLGLQEVRAIAAKGRSNPRDFEVSQFPEYREMEPNNLASNANSVAMPININGLLSEEKDVDTFKVKATKGQRFVFEVMASRFGSPIDALLTLSDTNGAVLQRNDDGAGADARFEHTFAADGEYLLSLRDLLDRGGEFHGYRIAIRPAAGASLSGKFLDDTLRVYKAGRVNVRAEVTRTGFGGSVEVNAVDLPAGVTASPLLIPAEFTGGTIQLQAIEGAAPGNYPLKLSATALVNGTKVTQALQPGAGDRPVKQAFLTVLENAPFTVDIVSFPSTAEQNVRATLEVEVIRAPDFNGEIVLSLEGFSAGRDPITKSFDPRGITFKAGETRGKLSLKPKFDSELGTRPIWVKAEAPYKGGQAVTYSRPVPFTVTEYPFTIATSLSRLVLTALPAGVVSSAAEADLVVRVSRRGLFGEEIALTYEGLPEGVTISSTNVLRGTGEALLKLVATDKAKAGTTNNLVVVGSASVNGRTFQQKTKPVTLMINAPIEVAEAAKKD